MEKSIFLSLKVFKPRNTHIIHFVADPWHFGTDLDPDPQICTRTSD